jgi:CheY-like chemotaxis protein
MTPLRILVVEDDALIGTLLGEMLTGMGHEVCGIESTESDAVTAAARLRPDLMIVDAKLGQGSGIRAVEAIRTARVPCLFTSGDTLSVLIQKPEAIVIQKPFDEARLAQAIARAIAPAAPLIGA